MARYRVQAPDGQIITIEGPEGASQEQVIAKAKELYRAKPVAAPAPAYDPTAEEAASGIAYTGESRPIDRTVGGFLKGAIQDPITSVRQIFGSEETRRKIQESEAAYQKLRKEQGEEGFEYSRLAGNILSPVNIAAPAAAATRAAAAGAGALRQAGVAGVAGGVLQPVTSPESAANFWAEKIEQVGLSGALGLLAQGGINLGGRSVDFLKDLLAPLSKKGQEQILQDLFKKLSGKELDKLSFASSKAEELVRGSKPTVAEAVADIPGAIPVQSLQRQLERDEATAALFSARRGQQASARQAALGAEVGPEIPGQTAISRLEAERAAVTGPMREEALDQANIAGRLLPQLQADEAARLAEAEQLSALQRQFTQIAGQQGMYASRPFAPVEGFPRVASRYKPSYEDNLERITEAIDAAKEAKSMAAQRKAEASYKAFQAQSLADEGFFPLTASPVVERINKILATPGDRSEVAIDTLSSLRDKLVARSNDKGIIDSRDLYTIRKEIADDIKQFGEARKTSDFRRLASLETNLKSLIDESIVKAGGTKWKDYVTNFATYSKKIDQARIGQELSKKLGNYVDDEERAGAFFNAVENSVSILRKASGAQRYSDLSQVLDKDMLAAVNAVQADVSRAAKAAVAGKKTTLGDKTVEESPQIPQLLNRAATITNALLTALRRNAVPEINRRAAELLLDPVAFSVFLSSIPKDKSNALAKALLPRLDDQTREAFVRAMGVEAGIVAPIGVGSRETALEE